jgi:hypothetical protein
MSNIQIIPSENINDLSAVNRKAYDIFSRSKIRDIAVKDLQEEINTAINVAYFDLGIKAVTNKNEEENRAKEIFIITKSVFEELQEPFYNTLRQGEIKIAVKNGSLRKYDDRNWQFIGVSTSNIIQSIRKYTENPKRAEFMTDYLKLTTKVEANIPTDEELKVIIKENIIRSYSVFAAKGWFDDPGFLIFKALYKMDLLNFEDKQMVKFYYIAKERLISHLKIKKQTDLYNRRVYQRQIEELEPLEGENMTNSKEISDEVNKVALNFFFKSLQEMEMSIEDMLE